MLHFANQLQSGRELESHALVFCGVNETKWQRLHAAHLLAQREKVRTLHEPRVSPGWQ